MKGLLRGFLALAIVALAATVAGPPDAAAQWVNNRTFANTEGHYSRLDKEGLEPGSCVGGCRERGCRSWVYVRGTSTSNGIPYCLFYRERRAMVYNNCCVAGYGAGGVTPPPPGRRAVINYPRWNGHVVDWCRVWASDCGWGGANYYCRLRGYERAERYTTYRPGSTYVIGSGRVCNGGGCVGFNQVVCVGYRSGGVVPPPPAGGGGGGGGVITVNNPSWNGAIVDWCRTWASDCGRGGADQYCRRRGWASAASWSTYRPGRTYVIGSSRFCNGGGCVGFSRVTCRR